MKNNPTGGASPIVDPLPVYSSEARLNRDFFLDTDNEIIFYFEDEGWEELYLRLINKICPQIKVKDVFCLGGKDALLRELRVKGGSEDRPKLFVADLDFDDLIRGFENDRRLIYLRRYSIENFWIDLEVFTQYVVNETKRNRKGEVRKRLDLQSLFDEVLSTYDRIARLFIMCQRYRLGVESTKLGIEAFLVRGCVALDLERLRTYELKVRKKAQQKQRNFGFNDELFNVEIDRAYSFLNGHHGYIEPLAHCRYPGKHLLGLIASRINEQFDLGLDLDDHFLLMSRTLDLLGAGQFESLRLDINKRIS